MCGNDLLKPERIEAFAGELGSSSMRARISTEMMPRMPPPSQARSL